MLCVSNLEIGIIAFPLAYKNGIIEYSPQKQISQNYRKKTETPKYSHYNETPDKFFFASNFCTQFETICRKTPNKCMILHLIYGHIG